MKSTSSTTASPSVSTSSHQQNEEVRKQRRTLVTIPGILVNQGQGKIKLEEDIPAPIKLETGSDSNQATSEVHDGETFTEEFIVTKEDVSFESSPEEPGQGQEGRKTSCACREEVESLKDSVKQLTLQVQKQNKVITGIKSSLRNAVLSLMTCCQDEHVRDEDDHSQGSPVIVNTFSKNGGPMTTPDISSAHQEATPPKKQVSCSGESTAQIQGASPNKSSSSKEAGLFRRQNTDVDVVMDVDDDKGEGDADVHDDDSSYGPDDGKPESDMEMEDSEQARPRNKIKLPSTKVIIKRSKRFVSTTASKADPPEQLFGCSKCGKTFKSKYTLAEHMNRLHSNNRPQYKCHLCPKIFNCISGVSYHIRTIHNGVRYKCAHCPGTFTRKSRADIHEKQVHAEGRPPTLQCKICGMRLINSETILRIHMSKMHKTVGTTSRPRKRVQKIKRRETTWTRIFRCQRCPSSFLQLKDLQCHLSGCHGIPFGSDARK